MTQRFFGNHPTLINGLRAYYPCNDSFADTNIRDATHNVDGTLIADTSADFSESGKVDKCFNWGAVGKGFQANIEAYPGELINYGKPTTVNMWVYLPPSDGTYHMMFGNQSVTKEGLGIMRKSTDNSIYVTWQFTPTGYSRIYNTPVIPDYTWTMMTVTYDGRTVSPAAGMTISFNAIEQSVTSVNTGTGAWTNSDPHISIGAQAGYASYTGFRGKQSDVGLWDRVLTPSEISALYNLGQGRAYNPVRNQLFDNDITLATDLVAEWMLDDNNPDTVVAETSGQFDGVMTTNTEDMAVAGGLFGGNMVDFGAGTNDYIDIDDTKGNIGWDKEFSTEMWFNGTGGTRYLWGYTGTPQGYRVIILFDNLTISGFTDSANYTQLTKNAVTTLLNAGLNQLVHTYDGNGNNDGFLAGSKVYLNGNLLTMGSVVAGTQVDFAPSTLAIGRIGSGYDPDEISTNRFWKRELSQDEVTRLYNNGNGRRSLDSTFQGHPELLEGLVSYYKCNETSGTTVTDTMGNHDGTATVDTSLLTVPGKSGLGFSFSGSSTERFDAQFETIPGDTFDYDKPFCTSFWYYVHSIGQGIMGNVPVVAYPGFYIYASSATNIYFRIRQSVADYRTATSGAPVAGWNHVLCGQDDTNTAAGTFMFLNGVLTAGIKTGADLTNVISSDPVMFGDTAPHSGFSRYMDEIAIYTKAPTQQMATDLYNEGKGRFL